MSAKRPIDSVALAAWWVAWSGACVLAGWSLSFVGLLGPTAYGGLVLLGLIASGWWVVRHGNAIGHRWRMRRWRRGWPAFFGVLWIAATLGGLLYAPSNIDALTYRLPRVLHWLDAGRWQWLPGPHLRMNYSATATEWISAPVLALVQSARPLFLCNALGLLLLPGLMFAWLRALGASGKAAWRWMWLTPAALGCALQAGSIANDLAGVVYFLAAMALAQRAEKTGMAAWLFFAAIALGLATNVKASNLALVPMTAVFLWRAWRGLTAHRVEWGLGALAAGLAVSVAPTLWLNTIHTGHWSGDPANLTFVQPGAPAAAVAGNALLLALQNLAPPFFPWAGAWNAWSEPALAAWWHGHFGAGSFPRLTPRLTELPQEEWAGLGLAFCGLIATEWWLARGRRRVMRNSTRLALWAGGAGGLVFMATMGSEMPGRLLLPFYLVPIAAVVVSAPPVDLRLRRGWRTIAAITMVVALAAVVLTPARPLFPAARLWARLQSAWPGQPIWSRASLAYAVYSARPDMLAPVRADLRAEETTVGFLATEDDSEWSLWLPLGGRRVRDVSNLAEARQAQLRVLVIRADAFWPDVAAEQAALAAAGFRADARHEIVVKASRPPERWLVARPLP